MRNDIWRKWFVEIREIVGPTQKWPRRILITFMKTHYSNQDRFSIFVFLCVNGMYPPRVVEFFDKTQILDTAANRQLTWLLQNWTRYKAWNVSLNKSV